MFVAFQIEDVVEYVCSNFQFHNIPHTYNTLHIISHTNFYFVYESVGSCSGSGSWICQVSVFECSNYKLQCQQQSYQMKNLLFSMFTCQKIHSSISAVNLAKNEKKECYFKAVATILFSILSFSTFMSSCKCVAANDLLANS